MEHTFTIDNTGCRGPFQPVSEDFHGNNSGVHVQHDHQRRGRPQHNSDFNVGAFTASSLAFMVALVNRVLQNLAAFEIPTQSAFCQVPWTTLRPTGGLGRGNVMKLISLHPRS